MTRNSLFKRRPSPGRPTRHTPARKIHISIDEDLAAALVERARVDRRTVSATVSLALAEFLDAHS